MEHISSSSLLLTAAAVGAWTVGERAISRPARRKYSETETDRAVLAAVNRAIGSEDVVYLKSRPARSRNLLRYLRSNRRRFLQAYLDQVRTQFVESSRLVRQFAADTDAPDLAFIALRQWIVFHALWLALRTSLLCRLVGPTWRLAEKLFGVSHLGTYAQESRQTAGSS